jgi:hypothetical protein
MPMNSTTSFRSSSGLIAPPFFTHRYRPRLARFALTRSTSCVLRIQGEKTGLESAWQSRYSSY